MNRIYKVIWSKVKHQYVVVSELAHSNGKQSRISRNSIRSRIAALVVCGAIAAFGVFGAVPNSAYAVAGGVATQSQYIAIATDSNSNDTANYGGYNYYKKSVSINGQTKYYYVREGYDISVVYGKRYAGADNSSAYIIDAKKNDQYNQSSDQGLLQAYQTTTSKGQITTLTGVNIEDLNTGVYGGASNAGGVDTPSDFGYHIKVNNLDGVFTVDDDGYIKVSNDLDGRGDWTIDAGVPGNTNFETYFSDKVTLENDGTYSYTHGNEKVTVPTNKVYSIGGKLGVFTDAKGNLYTGDVYGDNNEILLSAVGEGNQIYSYWGTKVNDPTQTIGNMTVQDYNSDRKKLQDQAAAYHGDDITNIAVGGAKNNGTISLNRVGQYNDQTGGYETTDPVPGTITVTSTGGNGGSGAEHDVKIKFSNTDEQGTEHSFTVDAGSKVVGKVTEDGHEQDAGVGDANKTLTGLKINGVDYALSQGKTYSNGNGISIDETTNKISVALAKDEKQNVSGLHFNEKDELVNDLQVKFYKEETETSTGTTNKDGGNWTITKTNEKGESVDLTNTTLDTDASSEYNYSESKDNLIKGDKDTSYENTKYGRNYKVIDTDGNEVALNDVASADTLKTIDTTKIGNLEYDSITGTEISKNDSVTAAIGKLDNKVNGGWNAVVNGTKINVTPQGNKNTLEFEAGNNVSITADENDNKITIATDLSDLSADETNAVLYDKDTNKTSVTLAGGESGTQIHNLADGTENTDAVNLGQLIGKTGDLQYKQNNTDNHYVNNGDNLTVSIGKLDTQVYQNTTSITKLQGQTIDGGYVEDGVINLTHKNDDNITKTVAQIDGLEDYTLQNGQFITKAKDENGKFTGATELTIADKYDPTKTEKVTIDGLVTYNTTQKLDETTGETIVTGIDYDNIRLAGENGTRITNLVDGWVDEKSTDAVNGSQLASVKDGAVKYWQNEDGSYDKSFVQLEGGEDGTLVTHVRDGAVNEYSSDAVNGSQLWETQQQIKNTQTEAEKHTTVTSIDKNVNIVNVNEDDPTKEKAYQVSLNPDLDVTSVTTGNSVMNTNGFKTTGEGGTSTTITPGNITLQGVGEWNKTTIGSSEITVGKIQINGNGTQVINGLSNTEWNGSTNTPNRAATEGQLESVSNDVASLNDGAVKYWQNEDGSYDKSFVQLEGGEEGTTITHLKDGAVNEYSSDAVNGSQLWETQQQIEEAQTEAGKHTTIQETGKNINVTKTETDGQLDYTINLNDDITLGNYTEGTGVVVSGSSGTISATNAISVGVDPNNEQKGIVISSGKSDSIVGLDNIEWKNDADWQKDNIQADRAATEGQLQQATSTLTTNERHIATNGGDNPEAPNNKYTVQADGTVSLTEVNGDGTPTKNTVVLDNVATKTQQDINTDKLTHIEHYAVDDEGNTEGKDYTQVEGTKLYNDGSISSTVKDGLGMSSDTLTFDESGLTVSKETMGNGSGSTNISGDTIKTVDEYGNETTIDGGSVTTEDLTVNTENGNKLTFDSTGLNVNSGDTGLSVNKDGISLSVDNGAGKNSSVKVTQDGTEFSYSENGIADATTTTIKGSTITTDTVTGLNNTKWDDELAKQVANSEELQGTAATQGQLQQAVSEVAEVANAGWTASDGTNSISVKPNETLNFVGDENLTVSADGTDKKLKVSLNDDITLGNPKAGNTEGERSFTINTTDPEGYVPESYETGSGADFIKENGGFMLFATDTQGYGVFGVTAKGSAWAKDFKTYTTDIYGNNTQYSLNEIGDAVAQMSSYYNKENGKSYTVFSRYLNEAEKDKPFVTVDGATRDIPLALRDDGAVLIGATIEGDDFIDNGIRINAETETTYDENGKEVTNNVATITGLENTTWTPPAPVATFANEGTETSRAATEAQLNDLYNTVAAYDVNADGTVNYNHITLAGTPYNYGLSRSTDGTPTGGTSITNVAYASGNDGSEAVNVDYLKDAINKAVEAGGSISNSDKHLVANTAEGSNGVYKPNAEGNVNLIVSDEKGNSSTVTIGDVASKTELDSLKTSVGDLNYDKVTGDKLVNGDSVTTAIGKLDNKIDNISGTATNADNNTVTGGTIKDDGTISLTQKDGDTVALDGKLTDSGVVQDGTKFDGETGTLTITSQDKYNKGTSSVTVSGIASKNDIGTVKDTIGATSKEDLKDAYKDADKDGNATTEFITESGSMVEADVALDHAIQDVANTSYANDMVLSNRIDNVENRLGEVEERIDKVGAMAAAIANLRTMGYDPEAPTEVAVGVGQYKSETGLALGIFHYPNQDFMLSASISTSGDEVMGGIGATWKLGRKSAEERAKDEEERILAKAEEIKQAAKRAEVKAQADRHAQLLAEREAAGQPIRPVEEA